MKRTLHPIEKKSDLRPGQRAADAVTRFIGSWTFILSTLILLGIWISINVAELIWQTWDPYPFILLNFILSCMAALQAPIILMSQNRVNERDRVRSEYDYKINRKAEHEIEQLQKDVKSIKTLLQQRLAKPPQKES